MRGDDDEEEESSVNATRYPCMPSLVALQQMRNRLHLAHLGKKLMKWTAMATGRELRRLACEIDETYKNFAEDMRSAFMLLARGRYFYPHLNNIVLENVELNASVLVSTSTKAISGVKVLQLEVIESGIEPYEHLGIEKGGQTIHVAKIAWRNLLKRLIMMLQQRTSFYQLELAHKSATKKKNVLAKIVIPRLAASIRYILTELEEKEREETFRLKRVKQNKIKALEDTEEVGAGEKTQVIDKKSETRAIQSYKKTTEEPVSKTPPAAEGGDPLVVIKPPEAGEIGDAYKSTQQLQTMKYEKEKEGLLGEDVEKKDLQQPIDETEGLTEKNSTLPAVPEFKPEEGFARKYVSSVHDTEALRESNGADILESFIEDDPTKSSGENKASEEALSSDHLISHPDTKIETIRSKLKTQDKKLDSQKSTKPAVDSKGKDSETSKEQEFTESSQDDGLSMVSTKKPEEIQEESEISKDKIALSTDIPNDSSLETSTLSEFSSNREIEEHKSALRSRKSIVIDDKKKMASSLVGRTVSSEISSTISQPETTNLFEETILPEIISHDNLKQDKISMPPLDDSVSPREKSKDISMENLPEVSKTETTKSKSSARIKLPESTSNDTQEEPQNEDFTSETETAHTSDVLASKTSKEVKRPVMLQDKETEGSVEKLGEGDNQMYTDQAQKELDKTITEHQASVQGIVDAEPYFEIATTSKELLENVNLREIQKEIISNDIEPSISRTAKSDERRYDYDEADIELDETDVDITSTVPHSSKDKGKNKEAEESDSEKQDEQRHDSNTDENDKPSKSSDDKKRRT